ncbi:MAG: hypothetical protein KKG76_10745, partial [Euryarchaeota archaeon]|nr:hypothetical protein [Euryarchaeota archaeon]
RTGETRGEDRSCRDAMNLLHNGTRMTRIVRIFTDPRVSASSAQSVFYRSHSRLKNSKLVDFSVILEKPRRTQRTQRKAVTFLCVKNEV